VLAPGKYRFLDFAKLGVPLQLIAMGGVANNPDLVAPLIRVFRPVVCC